MTKRKPHGNKGRAPWNKGKHLTEEDRKNKSVAAKKRASTPEGKTHIRKMRRLSHTPEAEEKRSKSISKWNIKRYKKNPELGKQITEKAHDKNREMVEHGTHPFQDPEIRIKTMKACSEKNYGGTWIEKRVGWLLDQMELKKETQKPIPYGYDAWGRQKYLFPDFVIPEHNLIIECDGEYWHQDKTRENERDDIFLNQGYKIVHLSGSQILENLESCKNEIFKTIK